jgi:hypothetical protein
MSKSEKDIRSLVDELLQRLSGREREKLKAQLSDDPSLEELEGLVGKLSDTPDTGEWQKLQSSAHLLLDSLLKDFRSAQDNPDEQHGVLTFDSGLLPLPEGVRPATVDTRRLRYQVGEDRLEVSLYPVSFKSYELIGQFSKEPAERVLRVDLVGVDGRFSIESDRFGVFRFARVTGGKYRLKISEGDRSLTIVDLEI